MTSIATGGFSTRNASIGAFASPAVDWIVIACMVVGSLLVATGYFSPIPPKLSNSEPQT